RGDDEDGVAIGMGAHERPPLFAIAPLLEPEPSEHVDHIIRAAMLERNRRDGSFGLVLGRAETLDEVARLADDLLRSDDRDTVPGSRCDEADAGRDSAPVARLPGILGEIGDVI